MKFQEETVWNQIIGNYPWLDVCAFSYFREVWRSRVGYSCRDHSMSGQNTKRIRFGIFLESQLVVTFSYMKNQFCLARKKTTRITLTRHPMASRPHCRLIMLMLIILMLIMLMLIMLLQIVLLLIIFMLIMFLLIWSC